MNSARSAACATLAFAALLDGLAPARAQALTEADFLDDLPVVLSVSRLSQPLNEAPAAVTVIDEDMIRASGFRDIPDLFRLVPGFTVAYTRDNTWGVGYHGLADAFSRRMQVLIDGRSVYTPAFGMVPWASLPLSIEDIERIEVVRGPNSAAYGSNAFLGIINIITKKPAQVPGSHVSVQTGAQGMAGAMYRLGGGEGDLLYRLTLSDQRRDRFDTQAEKTATRHLDWQVDYRLSPADEITANFALSRGDWRHGRPSDIEDPIRHMDVGTEHVQVKFRRTIDPENEWSLQFYHTRLRNEDGFVVSPSPVGPVPVDLGYTQRRDDIEFQRISHPFDPLRFVWGAEARWEAVDSPAYFYNQDVRSGALYRLFGNAEWRASPEWIVHAGALAEHHYLSGFDVSPRLAVNFLPSPDHAFRISVTRAYRSPTFFEEMGDQRIYSASGILVDQVFAPSAGLAPEQILSREVGYVGQIHSLKLRIDARFFSDRLSKLVGTRDIDPTSSKILQSFNELGANMRGADLQLRWAPWRWLDLTASYARVDIDADKKDVAASVPRNNFSALGIFRLDEGWAASVGVYKQDYMYWLGDGDRTEAFTRVDARLAKRLELRGNPVELAVVGQNLGGGRYQEFRNDNLFDRRAYLSLTFDW